jgi:ankyrin repeat protein
MIEILLENNADVNISDLSLFTPLLTAVKKGDLTIVNSLLKLGADPNFLSDENIPALIYACRKNRMDIAKVLISYGADVLFQTSNKTNALLCSVMNNNKDLFTYLLDFPFDVNHVNEAGDSVVSMIINRSYYHFLDVIFLHSVRFNEKNKNKLKSFRFQTIFDTE